MNVYALIANSQAKAPTTSEQAKAFSALNGERGVASFTAFGQKNETSFSELLHQQFAQLVHSPALVTLANEEAHGLDQIIEQLLSSEQWDEADWNALAQWLQTVFAQQGTDMSSGFRMDQFAGQGQDVHRLEQLAMMIADQWAKRSEEQALPNHAGNINRSDVSSFVATVKSLEPLWQHGIDDADAGEMELPLKRLVQALTATLEETSTRSASSLDEQANGTKEWQPLKPSTDHRAESQLNTSHNLAHRLSNVSANMVTDLDPLMLSRIQPASLQWTNGSSSSMETESIDLKMVDARFASVQSAMLSQHGDAANSQEQSGGSSQQATSNAENTAMSNMAFRFVDEAKTMSTQSESQPKANLPQSVHINNFADVMGRVLLKKWHASSLNGISEARIQLVPEHLGHLDVHIKIQNGLLTAQFMADKLMGKEMIESQIAVLRNALVNQGIQVDKIEVTHQPMHHGGTFQEQSQQRSFKQPSPDRKNVQAYAIGEDIWMEEAEGLGETSKRLAHGGVFDVTA